MSDALNRIISSKRLPVLFIGSGISKRYLINYPSWDELLHVLRDKIGVSKSAYTAYIHKCNTENPSPGQLNQKLASFLRDKFLSKIENDEFNLEEIFTTEEIDKCGDKNIDYFKMLVGKVFSEYSLRPEMSEELELFKKIGSKISMVFTTNYDTFLQNEIFPDFKVYESQNKYYFRTNNGYGELYKIHGCITDPNGIVICERDYQRFEDSLKLVSSKLINALIDFPVIFIGYSLEDENIKKIMADFINSFSDDIIQDIKKYIILVTYEKDQAELVEGEKQFVDSSSGRNITLTTIKTDNFTKLFNHIDELTPAASSYELRKYKTMIAELINRSAKGEKTVFVQEIDDASADITALYIGSKQTISNIEASVNIYTNYSIIEKGLDGEVFDYDSFALYWYENKCIKKTEYTPVFLIAHNISIKLENCCDKFRGNLKAITENFHKLSNINYDGNYCAIMGHYDNLKKTGKSSKTICDTICGECFKALYCNTITIDECKSILIHVKNNEPQVSDSSPFRKAACYMWYKMYYEK